MSKAAIRLAIPGDKMDWNAFVESGKVSCATPFHLWEWGEAVQDAHGHKPLRFIATCSNEIVGVLPLTFVRSALFGRSLISSAFAVGGGVLAVDNDVSEALAAAAIETGQDVSAGHIELRSQQAALETWTVKNNTHAGFKKPIDPDLEKRLASVPRKRRAELRKALALEEAGETCVRFNGDIKTFYDLYARSLRDLGTPVFSKTFASALLKYFDNKADITIVEAAGAPVAALLSFYFQGAVMPYYIGAVPEARDVRAFDLIYWRLMEHALDQGCSIFDFGRSKIGSPHQAYKKSWGFEAEPLEYQYRLLKGMSMPDVSPANAKFAFATAVWKKLPLPVANAVGPMLARHLP